MFRQAAVSNQEPPSERSRHFAKYDPVPGARAASSLDVQSVSMEIAPADVFRRRDNLVTREIAGETIVVPISGELADLQRVYSLNPTGAFIWQHVNGDNTLDAIHRALVKDFKIGEKDAWADLAELVAELAQAALIEKVQ
jgi:hypothetical protein